MQIPHRHLVEKLLRMCGRFLSIAGLGYVLWMLRDIKGGMGAVGAVQWGITVGVGTIGYLVGSLWLAWIWTWWFPVSAANGSRLRLVGLYSKTQIGKYLPGNVFHFVGRQECGIWPGFTQKQAAFASLLETVLLLVSASTFSLMAGRGLLQQRFEIPSYVWWGLGIGMLVAGVGLIVWRSGNGQFVETRAKLARFLCKVFVGIAGYAMYFLLIGGLFLLLGNPILGSEFRMMGFIERLWLYPVAWLAGVVTPGAPGGLGVRESLLVLALEPYVPSTTAAGYVLAFRLATVIGDIGLWGIGCFITNLADHRLKTESSQSTTP